ncbi:saccharopine dehydrogenase NADP-binding domain-containing protein [Clostridium oceanicum]|uniref:NAD-dependent epimerase/dehydratase family protein n=1 Tax=Clostridium oceanicum TaxID=1543 RepID=A0ABP3UK94_9CLOT
MNKSPLIGIVGCGGKVGSIVIDMLVEKYKIRGGQRSPCTTIYSDDRFKWKYLDIYDDDSLTEFCNDCDAILNCSGPSYLIKDRVAYFAMKAGAKYIDAFGDRIVKEKIKSKNYDLNNLFILSAGCFPGLSSLATMWFSNRYFSSVNEITIYSGGNESFSKTSCKDVVLSSINGFGKADSYYLNGGIIKDLKKYDNLINLYGSKYPVYLQSFFSEELYKIASDLKVEKAHWYNISTDKTKWEKLSYICRNVISGEKNDINEIINDSKLDFNNNPNDQWYSFIIDITGTSYDKPIRKRLILRCLNSYILTSIVSSITVEYALKSEERGVFYASQLLLDDKTMRYIFNNEKVNCEIIDLPLDYKDKTNLFQEGEI